MSCFIQYVTVQLCLIVLLACVRNLMVLIIKVHETLILDRDDDPRFSLDYWCRHQSEDTPQTNAVQRQASVTSVDTQVDGLPAPLPRRNSRTATWSRPPFQTERVATNGNYLTPPPMPGSRKSGAYAWKPNTFGNGDVPGLRFGFPSPFLPVQNTYRYRTSPPPQSFSVDARFGLPETPRFLAPDLAPVAFGPPWQTQPPNPTAFAAPSYFVIPACGQQPFPCPGDVLMPPPQMRRL